MKKPISFLFLWLALSGLPANGTVTIELAVGRLSDVGPGDVGILVADRASNGFQTPQAGFVIEQGATVGPADDIIVAVFQVENGLHWNGGAGFSGIAAGVDLDELGISAGVPLKFFWLPGKRPGESVQEGEFWHCFREDAAGASGGTIGFSAPPNYGVFRISQLSTDLGGDFDPAAPANSGVYREGSALGVVSGLTGKVLSDGSVRLSWSGVGGATGYRIHRSTTGFFKDAVVSGETGQATFTDTGLAGGSYSYWVETLFVDDSSLAKVASLEPEDLPRGIVRPDLTIGQRLSRQIGVNTISDNPAIQLLKIATRKQRKAKAFSILNNRGSGPGTIKMGGSRGNRLFKTKYLRISPPSANVTGELRSNGYISGILPPAGSESFKALVKPNRSLGNRKKRYNLNLQAESTDGQPGSDVVRIQVKRSP